MANKKSVNTISDYIGSLKTVKGRKLRGFGMYCISVSEDIRKTMSERELEDFIRGCKIKGYRVVLQGDPV